MTVVMKRISHDLGISQIFIINQLSLSVFYSLTKAAMHLVMNTQCVVKKIIYNHINHEKSNII